MEKWKAIPGYEGSYEVSNEGRVRSVEGKVTSSARFPHRVWKQRIMKQKIAARKSGPFKDARICLWKDGKSRTFLVSRLVASAWIEGCQEGMTVNHKDGNPLNNNVDNLEWMSIAENINHAFDNLLMTTQKPCILINESGEEKWFRSFNEASKGIGRSNHYISTCLYRGTPITGSNGETYDIA